MTSIAYERVIESIASRGFKIQHHGKDRARAQCPGHGGEDLNLAIAVGDQGVLVKCMSYDCPAEDIATAVGLTLGDLFDKDGHAEYDYGNGHRVIRRRTREGKRIVQQNKPQITSLYRHPYSMPIEESDLVVLVEGEKCVDAALHLGERCVTTWPGGASAVGQVDLSPLSGKRIRIIGDNDEAGRQAVAKLIARLAGIAEVDSVWTAPIEKQGVDDIWLAGGSLADLVPLLVEAEPVDQPDRGFVLTRLSDVRSRTPRFLWEGVLPFGCVTLLGGRGGVSKSTFVAGHLAGKITQGVLPGELFGTPTPVLYVSHEDSLEEVIANRCVANNVDRERFFQLGIRSKEVGGITVPRLPEDLPEIRKAIEASGAKVIIIDPITSTIGGDNDKMADVRAVLDPLNALGAEMGVSILAIAHFRKGSSGSTSDLISGSHAYRDAARCVMLFAKDEETGFTIATVEKSNYGVSGQSFEFETVVVEVMTDEGSLATTTRVQWHGASSKDVGDVMAQETSERTGTLLNDVTRFVCEQRGAISTKDVVREMSGHKEGTVRNALSKAVKRGLIASPAWGWYSAPIVTAEEVVTPRPGGVTTVTSVTTAALSQLTVPQENGSDQDLSHLSHLSQHPPARSLSPDVCTVCGYSLHPSLIALGESVHPSC